MMQGRESRSTTARALVCALMAILAFAAVVPASVSAQAAGEEYTQPNIPTGGNDDSPAAATPASDSGDDGGGASILLVALAAVAAVCAGFAAWRLRGGGHDDDSGPPQTVAPSTGSETH